MSQCCSYAVDHIVAPSPSNNTRKICIWICAWNNYVSYTLVCVHFMCSMYVSSCSTPSFSCPSLSSPSFSVRHFPVLQFQLSQNVTHCQLCPWPDRTHTGWPGLLCSLCSRHGGASGEWPAAAVVYIRPIIAVWSPAARPRFAASHAVNGNEPRELSQTEIYGRHDKRIWISRAVRFLDRKYIGQLFMATDAWAPYQHLWVAVKGDL